MDLKQTPRHEKKTKKTTQVLSNRAVPHIKNKDPWDKHTRMDTYTKTHTGTAIFYAQARI